MISFNSIICLELILLVTFVVFLSVYKIFRVVYSGQGSFDFSNLKYRLWNVIVKGFGQKLVLRECSGFFHLIIFWGFISLSFSALEGLISAVFPNFSFSFLGSFYLVLNSSQDIFAGLIVVALLASCYRRIILKPKRLETDSLRHKADSFIVIALIMAVVITFFVIRSIDVKPGFTPISDVLRTTIFPESSNNKNTFFITSLIHNLVILGFLCYIPFSKHLHLFSALPNLFFNDQSKIPGAVDKIDFEDEEREIYGVEKLSDYTKKDLLDLTACTECGRCQEVCPAYLTGKPLSPKKVVRDLKSHLIKLAFSSEKSDSVKNVKLFEEVIERDALWSCVTCGACTDACPIEIDPISKLIGIRQNRVLMESDMPDNVGTTLKNIENQSNPWGFPIDERAKWADDLDVKIMAESNNIEYLFFVGCAGSYDQRYIKTSRAIVKILKKAGINFGILGKEENCSCDSAKRIGNEYLAEMLIHQNIEKFNQYGVKKIITGCPHCYNTIKNEYPLYGGVFHIVHHTTFINELIKKGLLSIKIDDDSDEKVTYHDSCYLGRYNGEYKAPREILSKSVGEKFTELSRNGRKSFCCGAGGGRMWMEEKVGTRINSERVKEAIDSNAKTIATACPFCMNMITDGIKSEKAEDRIKVKDVAEIVADNVL